MYQIGNDYSAFLKARRADNEARRTREAFIIIAFVLAVLVLSIITTGCSAQLDVCSELRAGASLLQTSEAGVFDLLRAGRIVAENITLAQIRACGY